MINSDLCKATQTVKHGQGMGILLNSGQILHHRRHQFLVQLQFKGEYLFFCARNFLFVFLEFRRNVAFGIGQCLLSCPLGGHLIFMGVGHFQVVAKHIIKTDLQGTDPGFFRLSRLQTRQVFFSVMGNIAELIQLFVYTRTNHRSFSRRRGGLIA